jgi:ATP-dependent Clp protease protease subunit
MPVGTSSLRYAASAASLVAIAGKKCIMAPSSMMMIHKAWTFAVGNSDDLLETADLLDKIDGQLAESYAAKSGKKAADFTAIMGKDTWYTPQEAVDAGLCDEIASDAKEPAASAAATLWDMSAFDNAPKPKVPTESEKAAAAQAAAAKVTAAAIAAEESERQAASGSCGGVWRSEASAAVRGWSTSITTPACRFSRSPPTPRTSGPI